MSDSFWLRKHPPDPVRECDICIVGGGITGVSLAYWLSRTDPNVRLVLLEAHELASGASGRNAGFVLSGLAEHQVRVEEWLGRDKAEQLYRTTVENGNLVASLAEQHTIHCDYLRCGSIVAGLTENEMREIVESAEIIERYGFDSVVLSADEMNSKLQGTGFTGGAFVPHDAALDPVRFVRGLASVIPLSCEILEHCPVVGVQTDGDVIEVRTRCGDVRAAMTVFALNAYVPLVAPFFEGLVEPTRGQVLVTEPLNVGIGGESVAYVDYGYEYFHRLDDGRFLLGGWRQHDEQAERGYSDEVTSPVQRGLESFLAEHFPQAKDARIDYRWSGVMGFSVDGLPLVGSVPGVSGLVACVGFTGHGMGLAVEITRRLARVLLDGGRDDVLDLFNTSRVRSR